MPEPQALPSVKDVPVRALPTIRDFAGVRSNANPMALGRQEAVYARNVITDEQGVIRRRAGYFKLNANGGLPGLPANLHRFYQRDGDIETLAWCSDAGAGDLRKYNSATGAFEQVTNANGPMQYADGKTIGKAQVNDVVFYSDQAGVLRHYSGKLPTEDDTLAGGVVLASGLPIPQETYSAADGAVGPPGVDEADPQYVVVFTRADTNRNITIVSDPTDPFSPASHDAGPPAKKVTITLPAVNNTGAVYGTTALFNQTFYKYNPTGVDILIRRSVYRLATDGQYRLVESGLDGSGATTCTDALTNAALLDKDALHNGDFGDGGNSRVLARGHGRPPSGAKVLFTHHNMLVMYNAIDWLGGVPGTRRKKTAFFSVPGFHEYFPEENQWDFGASDDGDELIAGASSEDGCLALCHNRSYFMRTFLVEALQRGAQSLEISGQYGCQAPRSLANVNGTWFWLSHAGVVAYQIGAREAVLMRNDVSNLLDNLTLSQRMDAVGSHDGDLYVLSFPDSRGTTLVYNTRTDRWLAWDNQPRLAVAYLDSQNEGNQYLWADNRTQFLLATPAEAYSAVDDAAGTGVDVATPTYRVVFVRDDTASGNADLVSDGSTAFSPETHTNPRDVNITLPVVSAATQTLLRLGGTATATRSLYRLGSDGTYHRVTTGLVLTDTTYKDVMNDAVLLTQPALASATERVIQQSGGVVDDVYHTTFEWRSGYLDFGLPRIRKIIRNVQAVIVCSRDLTLFLGAEVKGYAWAVNVPATTSPWSWGGYFWWRAGPAPPLNPPEPDKPYWSSRKGLQLFDIATPMDLQGERLWWGFSITSRPSSPVNILKFHELVLLGQLVPSGR